MRIIARIPVVDKQKQQDLFASHWVKLEEPGTMLTAILASIPFMALNFTITLLIVGMFVPVSLQVLWHSRDLVFVPDRSASPGVRGDWNTGRPRTGSSALHTGFYPFRYHRCGNYVWWRICVYGRTIDPDTLRYHQLRTVYRHISNPAPDTGHAAPALSADNRTPASELPGIFSGYPHGSPCAYASSPGAHLVANGRETYWKTDG